MARETKPGPAAVQAAPEISFKSISSQASDLHDHMAYELLPALKVLQFALNTNRVLHDISVHAKVYPEFNNSMKLACSSWFDPFAAGDAQDILNDFARVVVGMAARLTEDAEGLDADLARIEASHTANKSGRA